MYIRDAVNYLQRKNVFIVRKLKEYGHSGDQLHVINIHATILVTMIYQARESGIIWQKSFAEIVNLLNAPGNNRYRNFLSYLVDLKLLEVIKSGTANVYQPVMGDKEESEPLYIHSDTGSEIDISNLGMMQSPCFPITLENHANSEAYQRTLDNWGFTLISFDTNDFIANKTLNIINFFALSRDNHLLKGTWLVINKVRKIPYEWLRNFWRDTTPVNINNHKLSYATNRTLPDFRQLSEAFYDPATPDRERGFEYAQLLKDLFAKEGKEYVDFRKRYPQNFMDEDETETVSKLQSITVPSLPEGIVKPPAGTIQLVETPTKHLTFKTPVLQEVYELLISDLNEDLKLKLIKALV